MGGAGGATMPTPNRGLQAAAMAQLTHAIRILEKSLPMLGVETEIGQAVMKALQSLSKHVPAGSGSPGVEQSGLAKMMGEQRQEQPMLQVMKAMGQGGQGQPSPQPAQAA